MNDYDLKTRWYEALKNDVTTYVRNYQLRHELSGDLVTIQELSEFFGAPKGLVYQVCEDAELNINVAIGIKGVGYFDLEIGEYTVEVLEQ